MTIVVDASVAIKRVVTEAGSDKATLLFQKLVDDPPALFWVPDLFFAECGNILWKRVRRTETTAELARIHEQYLRDLPFCVFPLRDLSHQAFELALKHDISVYDGCYGALSNHLGVPFVTADEKLARKLTGAIQIVLLSDWR